MQRFDTEVEAENAAEEYLTDINCNNSLTKDEKMTGSEAFMITDKGCFMGILDGEPWFVTYPKDIKGKDGAIAHKKGDNVFDTKFFMLEGKMEVSVRTVPGT